MMHKQFGFFKTLDEVLSLPEEQRLAMLEDIVEVIEGMPENDVGIDWYYHDQHAGTRIITDLIRTIRAYADERRRLRLFLRDWMQEVT